MGVRLLVDPFEQPAMGSFVDEAEEGLVGELEIPLDVLPAFVGIPPGAGEREGAVGCGDGATVGTGEEGERVMMAAAEFGGDVDLYSWTVAF